MRSERLSEPLSLTGRRLFITGGTGFLGRSLLDYLAEAAARRGADFELTVLTRQPDAFLDKFPGYRDHSWLRFVKGDLGGLPERSDYSDLIHAAADTHRGGDKIAWFDQLVSGTRNVLEFAVECGVSRMLFVSSGAVYGGDRAGDRPDEAAALIAPPVLDAKTVYGQGKRAAEHLCALFAERYGLECVIARCFAIMSPHMPWDGPYAAGNFIRDVLAQDDGPVLIKGNPQTRRSYIYGRDLAHWLITLLDRGNPGEAYNVGSDEAVSMLELVRAIKSALVSDRPIEIETRAETFPASTYVPSISKAQALGLEIETPLESAILQSAAWCR